MLFDVVIHIYTYARCPRYFHGDYDMDMTITVVRGKNSTNFLMEEIQASSAGRVLVRFSFVEENHGIRID